MGKDDKRLKKKHRLKGPYKQTDNLRGKYMKTNKDLSTLK